MNRKAGKFFDAITLLREDLVEEAQRYVFRRRRSGWRKFGSLAACVALVVSLGILAAVPRGCGSSGGSDQNSSGAPTTPAEAPPDANGNIPYGDGDEGGDPDTAPVPEPSGEAPPDTGMGAPVRFEAQVLEILEDGLLVELLPDEGLLMGASRVRIPTVGLDGLSNLQPGDVVAVSCETLYLEDGEAIAEGVVMLDLVEPQAP